MRIEKNCSSVITNKIIIKDMDYNNDLTIHITNEKTVIINHSVRLNKEAVCDIAREIIQHYSK